MPIMKKCSRPWFALILLSVAALTVQKVFIFIQWSAVSVETMTLKPAVIGMQVEPLTLKPAVHIVYATDKEQLIGMQASIQSLLENSKTPESIVVHIFRLASNATGPATNALEDKELLPLRTQIESTDATLKVHDYQFSEIEPFLNTHFADIKTRGNLLAPSNYVRFLLSTKLLDIDMCMWVDSDTIIRGDIVTFMAARDASKAMGAFSRGFSSLSDAMRDTLKAKGVDVAPATPSFNAGIIVLNLKLWREQKAYDQVLEICNLNRELKLWTKFGSQPPLQVLFSGDRFEKLPSNLYVDGMGYKENQQPNKGMFLHWNGFHKPWLSDGLYKEYWEQYNRVKKEKYR